MARLLTLSEADYREITSRLIFERAAQLDAAREADKKGEGYGDGWREQAQKTAGLLDAMYRNKMTA